MAKDIGLHNIFSIEWNRYIKGLIHCEVRLTEREDLLVWSWNIATCQVTAKLGYEAIISSFVKTYDKWWFQILCKWWVSFNLKLLC